MIKGKLKNQCHLKKRQKQREERQRNPRRKRRMMSGLNVKRQWMSPKKPLRRERMSLAKKERPSISRNKRKPNEGKRDQEDFEDRVEFTTVSNCLTVNNSNNL